MTHLYGETGENTVMTPDFLAAVQTSPINHQMVSEGFVHHTDLRRIFWLIFLSDWLAFRKHLHARAEHSTLKLDLCSASILGGATALELRLHLHGKKTFPIPLAITESVSEMGQDVEGAMLDIQHWLGVAQGQELSFI